MPYHWQMSEIIQTGKVTSTMSYNIWSAVMHLENEIISYITVTIIFFSNFSAALAEIR